MEIIQNKDFLSIDAPVEHIKELIYERKDISEVRDRIERFFTGIEPAFFRLISGSAGCGKTTSVLYVLYNFIKNNPQFSKDFVYINGSNIKTPKGMFKYLAQQLNTRTKDNTISSYAQDIEAKLNESQRAKLIVIDEVDKIYKNSRDSPKYLFLHSLNRMDVRPRHAILMITNDFNLTRNFAPELTGTLIETVFNAYNAADILEILKLRAKYCLKHNFYTMDDLAKIAFETYNNPIGGNRANIRHALNILFNATLLAQEKNKLISDVLEDAMEKVRIDNYVKLLEKYNRHLIILIKALALLKKKGSVGIYRFTNPDINYDEIKLTFFKLLEAEENRVISEAQLRKYIEQLVSENLLVRANRAKYNFLDDADTILEAIEKIR